MHKQIPEPSKRSLRTIRSRPRRRKLNIPTHMVLRATPVPFAKYSPQVRHPSSHLQISEEQESRRPSILPSLNEPSHLAFPPPPYRLYHLSYPHISLPPSHRPSDSVVFAHRPSGSHSARPPLHPPILPPFPPLASPRATPCSSAPGPDVPTQCGHLRWWHRLELRKRSCRSILCRGSEAWIRCRLGRGLRWWSWVERYWTLERCREGASWRGIRERCRCLPRLRACADGIGQQGTRKWPCTNGTQKIHTYAFGGQRLVTWNVRAEFPGLVADGVCVARGGHVGGCSLGYLEYGL